MDTRISADLLKAIHVSDLSTLILHKLFMAIMKYESKIGNELQLLCVVHRNFLGIGQVTSFTEGSEIRIHSIYTL